MVRIQSSVRTNQVLTLAQGRATATAASRSAALASAAPKTDFRTQLARVTPVTTGTSAAATQTAPVITGESEAGSSTGPDWRVLFSSPAPTPAVAESPATPAAPTAESVFGANPWVSQPTGTGPGGITYSYNPQYFATQETAAKVAQMVGGTVIQSNQFTPNGGPFAQSQQNYMVKLADGRMINPGLVASFYTHGYPQHYVDQMIRNEVSNA